MSAQLKGVIGYMNSRGGAGPLNAAGSPVLAGDVWSKYEAPLVPLSDTRPGIANQLFAELSGGSPAAAKNVKPHSAGGMVSEPVYGTGAYSGMPYSFAEDGQSEYVGPLSGNSAPGNPGMPGATNIGQQQMIQLLQTLIRQGQQLPQALGSALSTSGRGGVAHGYYGAQG
jgi:hypothetical protein